jgi:hypothetical protein
LLTPNGERTIGMKASIALASPRQCPYKPARTLASAGG